MRRLALLTGLLLAVSASGAFARTTSVTAAKTSGGVAPRIGPGMGVIPAAGVRQAASAAPQAPVIPVVYHGGPVMRDVTIHTVFWAPPGYRFSGSPTRGTLGYQELIQQFFTDVAAGSGSASSIFSILPGYSDSLGPGSTLLHYDHTVDSVQDTHPFPSVAAGCPSPAGIAVCLTDSQVRSEVDSIVAAFDPSGRGLHDIWFVFLAPDVDECLAPGSCASNAFAGYHSLSPGASGYAIYSVIPDPSVELTPGPGSDPQGNPAAETAIDTAAHETIEAITNPDGSGWMDPNGAETGDKCEQGPQYGAPLGFAADGSPYNQVLAGHQYLIQMMWSNRASGCVQAEPSTGALPPSPAQIYLTQFSDSISGATGIAKKGIDVEAVLQRAGQPVAIGVGTTRADGTWGPVQLSDPFGASHAVGDDRDILSVGYSQGGPGTDVVLTGNGGNPFTQAGWTGWYALDSGFRVTSTARGGRVLVAPCSQTGVLRLRIAGALRLSPVATCDPEANASRTVTGALGSRSAVMLASNDNRGLFGENPYGALVRLTVQAGEPNSVASLQNSQIPYDPTGFPTCTGDLENGGVACSGLVPRARYSLIRRRSGAVLHVAAGRDGVVRARGFRGGLRGGDVVALRNSGGRILTRLHVAHLRVDIDGAQTVLAAGTCESGDYYGTGLSDVPTSQAAVVLGVAGTGQVCPLSGDATGLSSNRIQQTDDFSGGLTQTRVPSIGATSPGDDATVYGSFVALANAVLPGPHGAVLSAHARAALTITPGAGGKPVFHSRNVNTPTGVRVFGLAPGVYRATWVVVDANGDTRTTRTRFIQA